MAKKHLSFLEFYDRKEFEDEMKIENRFHKLSNIFPQ